MLPEYKTIVLLVNNNLIREDISMKRIIKNAICLSILSVISVSNIFALDPALPKKPSTVKEAPKKTEPVKKGETQNSLPKKSAEEPAKSLPKQTDAVATWCDNYWFEDFSKWDNNSRFDDDWDYWDEWVYQNKVSNKNKAVKLETLTGRITCKKEYGVDVYKITTKNNKTYELLTQDDLNERVKPTAKKVEPKKPEPKKPTVKKVEPKKPQPIKKDLKVVEPKKPSVPEKVISEPKKPEPVKPGTPKVEPKKPEAPKAVELKKPEPKKIVEPKKPTIKKAEKTKKPIAVSRANMNKYKNKIVTVKGYYNENDGRFVVLEINY